MRARGFCFRPSIDVESQDVAFGDGAKVRVVREASQIAPPNVPAKPTKSALRDGTALDIMAVSLPRRAASMSRLDAILPRLRRGGGRGLSR